ncbi:hypothetical protein B0H13DRAFT_1867029 [Mycena leptocephala]|nr:hypothetical protein B0H13DRAFT_1867029 [Mycena leptocephala]
MPLNASQSERLKTEMVGALVSDAECPTTKESAKNAKQCSFHISIEHQLPLQRASQLAFETRDPSRKQQNVTGHSDTRLAVSRAPRSRSPHFQHVSNGERPVLGNCELPGESAHNAEFDHLGDDGGAEHFVVECRGDVCADSRSVCDVGARTDKTTPLRRRAAAIWRWLASAATGNQNGWVSDCSRFRSCPRKMIFGEGNLPGLDAAVLNSPVEKRTYIRDRHRRADKRVQQALALNLCSVSHPAVDNADDVGGQAGQIRQKKSTYASIEVTYPNLSPQCFSMGSNGISLVLLYNSSENYGSGVPAAARRMPQTTNIREWSNPKHGIPLAR